MVIYKIVMTEDLCTEFDLVFCRQSQSIFLFKDILELHAD